jgi:hypothetical protein
MKLEVEGRLRRIAHNLFLENFEKEKFLKMYELSDPMKRDYMLLEIEQESQSKDYEKRRRLRQIIRDS